MKTTNTNQAVKATANHYTVEDTRQAGRNQFRVMWNKTAPIASCENESSATLICSRLNEHAALVAVAEAAASLIYSQNSRMSHSDKSVVSHDEFIKVMEALTALAAVRQQ